MRRLLLIIPLLVLVNNTVLGQQRDCDLFCRFITPQTGDFYKLPNTIFAQYRIINLGPDTIYEVDTLRFQARVINDGKYYNIPVGKNLKPNDSIIIYDTLDLIDPNPPILNNIAIFRFKFRPIFVSVKNHPTIKPLSGYDFARLDNNYDTAYLTYRSSTSYIEDVNYEQPKFYPNPLNESGILIMPNVAEKTEVSVLDINGKLVDVLKVTSSSLDLSKLKSGMYILSFVSDNTRVNHKIIKP